MIKKLIKNNIYFLVGFLVVFVAIYLLSNSFSDQEIRTFLQKTGLWAPFFFILLYTLTYIVAPLSGSPFLFAGFYAFGINVIFLATASGFIASIINFWIARKFGRRLVVKVAGYENTKKIDKLVNRYGPFTLFLLRIFQGGVHDILSYAAGLTSMRFTNYIIASTLGMIPGTILWYLLSLQVETPIAFTILTVTLGFVLSVLFILGGLLFRKIKQKRIKK